MGLDEKSSVYLPYLNSERCTDCGLCLSACPGYEVNFQELNSKIFNHNYEHPLLGKAISSYVCHAIDHNIRYTSASGGAITALLIFALEKGFIDGALVTKMNSANPLRPFPFIARTRDEIISSASSKYCPVPANIALKEILKNKGRYAIVGLPCHIHGIRKSEILNKELRERIIYHFGLVCNHVPTFHATNYILRKVNRGGDKIKSIRYRGEGWPGGMSINYQDDSCSFINYLDFTYWGYTFQKFFWSYRCLLCDDKINELSDISFMDAWLSEMEKKEEPGLSLMLIRSAEVEVLIKQAMNEKIIAGSKIDFQKVVESQGLEGVKRINSVRRKIFSSMKRKIPKYQGHSYPRISKVEIMKVFYDLLVNCLGNYSFSFLRGYSTFYKFARHIKHRIVRII